MDPSHVITLVIAVLAVVGVVTGAGALFSLGSGKSYDK